MLNSEQSVVLEEIIELYNTHAITINTSDPGKGKTYLACGLAWELELDLIIVAPLSAQKKWRDVSKKFNVSIKWLGSFDRLKQYGRGSLLDSDLSPSDAYLSYLEQGCLVVIDEVHKAKGNSENNRAAVALMKPVYSNWSNDGDSVGLLLSATSFDKIEHRENILRVMQIDSYLLAETIVANAGQEASSQQTSFEYDLDLDDSEEDIYGTVYELLRTAMPNTKSQELIVETIRVTINNNHIQNEIDRQIKKGFSGGAKAKELITLAKIESVLGLIAEILESEQSSKVVVFTSFQSAIDQITDTFNEHLADSFGTAYYIDSRVVDDEREQIVEEFQTDSSVRLLSMSSFITEGIDLDDQVGDSPRYFIMLLDNNLINATQSIGRGLREGTKSPLTVYITLGKFRKSINAYEDRMMDNLKNKSDILNLASGNDSTFLS